MLVTSSRLECVFGGFNGNYWYFPGARYERCQTGQRYDPTVTMKSEEEKTNRLGISDGMETPWKNRTSIGDPGIDGLMKIIKFGS